MFNQWTYLQQSFLTGDVVQLRVKLTECTKLVIEGTIEYVY